MNPLAFAWNHPVNNIINPQYYRKDDYTVPASYDQNVYLNEDLNFDGKDEVIEVGNFGMRNGQNVSGTFIRLGNNYDVFYKISDYTGKDVHIIDFNGDGEKEIFVDGEVFNFYFGSNNQSVSLIKKLDRPITSGEFKIKHVGDFNGDGIQDIIVKQLGTYFVYFGDANMGYNSRYQIDNYSVVSGALACVEGDFIGKGTTNFCILKTSTSSSDLVIETLELELLSGTDKYSFASKSTQNNLLNGLSQLDGFTSGDFNGDGKTDVLVAYKENSSTRTKILYSYGKGFEQQEISTPLFGMFSQWGSHRVLDLNNDGISDLVFYRSLKVFEQSKWNYKLQMNKYIKKPGVSGSFVVEEVSISSKFILNQNYLEEIEDDGLLLGDFSGNGNYSCFRSFHFFNDAQPPIYAGRCSEIFSSDSGIPPIDAISSITDGFGKTEMISYKKFVPGLAKTTFPVTNFNQSFFVVDQVFADLGKPVAVQKYSYRNMLAHAQGKGLLGFEYTGVTDLINNTYSEVRNEIYNSSETGNAGRLIILPFPAKAITTYLAETPVNNKKMSESSSQIDVFRTRFDSNSPQSKENLIHIPLVTLSVSQSWDIDDNNTYMGCNVQVQKKEDFDVFGNLKKTVSYADESKSTNFPGQESDYSWVEIVETKYVTPDQNDQAKWIISRPEKITAISKHYPKSGDCKQPEVYTSVTEFEYYKHNEAHYPLLHYKWELPSGNENLTTTAEFDYDVFGNVIKKTITTPVEAGVENIKITDYIYNPDATHRGRFLTTEKVNAGSVGDAMVTTYEYSASTGLLKSKTDINGLVTSYGYDAFGKNNLTTMPDGTSVATLIGWSNASEDAPESALYYIAKVRFVPNWTMVWDKEIVFFDKLQRTLRSVSWNLSSKAVYSDKEYDEFGRVSQVSEPYFKNSEPSLFTTYQYDRAGRNYSITTPTGAKILTETKGRVTKVTNMITENWTEKEVNIKGKPLKINDKTNGNIEFCYDAAGRETSIKKYGIITSFEYDDFGNRTVIDDPDAGVTVTEYNKQNQIKYSTDARKNKLEFKHDYLGRLEYRINFTDNDKVEYKYYDKSAENGFGKLKSITKTDLSNGAQIHKTEFSYDNLERIIERKEHIDNEIFTFTYNYNGKTGELEYYQYPSGYRIQYFYNNEGYMHVVKDVTTNKILWSALDNNARGQLTDVALGNGLLTNYQFDAYGFPRRITTTDFNNKHLIKPYSDNAESWPEAETETIQDNSYIFDIHNGNLTKKWELYANNAWFCEAYEYDGVLKERLKKWYKYPGGAEYSIEYSNNGNINSKTGITVPGGSYVYGTNAGPHAVTGITGATQDYIGLIGNNPQTVLYNGINMPYYINQMAQTGGFKMDRIKITYGNGDQRVKTEFSTVYEHYIETDTRYYFGDFEVEKKYNTNKKVYYHYLAGTNGVFAIMKSDGIEDNSIYYIHTDYLGSFQVISDQHGDKIQQLSFDPWGRRRNPADGSFTNLPATFLFSRGFTGHEHYDKFGLINMNARLYDPFLGRFLSPDPQVQAPGYGQNYNRYTYALNNPLKYTDPDGEFFATIFAFVTDLLATVFVNGGIDPWNTSKNRNEAWKKFDPTAVWSKTNKGFKIDMGLFKTDPNKSLLGRAWEVVSRFTWQLPQTALGYSGSLMHNTFGGVKSVNYYGGATVVESYSSKWGGITLGSYINVQNGTLTDPSDRLFQHEYGHYLQSQSSGWFYLSKYGIPSLLSKDPHKNHPAEQDANVRAFMYFSKYEDGFNWVDEFGIQRTKWVYSGSNSNPINGYDWSSPFTFEANQTILNRRKLKLKWFDYLLLPTIITPGLINALILNNRY